MSPMMDFKKETRNNPVYPEGTYHVRISEFKRVVASTGTHQIRWYANIIEPVEHAGRVIVEHTPLTDKALWKVANLINGCGIDTTKLEKMDTTGDLFDRVCHACVGRTAYWRNTAGTDQNGNPRNNIVEYKQDTNQDVIEFTNSDDVPAFAKESWDEEK